MREEDYRNPFKKVEVQWQTKKDSYVKPCVSTLKEVKKT